MKPYCFNCKYWERCKGVRIGKCRKFPDGHYVDIVVAGGYSQPDAVITLDTFYCAAHQHKKEV